MAKVLVLGGDHQNTLGVVEALGQKGIKPVVVVLFCSKSFVLKSKYVSKGFIAKEQCDAIDFITYYFERCNESVPCIACSDDAAVLLDENRSLLPNCLIIPTVKEVGTLSLWMNKQKMSEEAASIGLTVPKSWLIEDGIIPDDIIFPCVTKPFTSAAHGKNGFSICQNTEELSKHIIDLGVKEPMQVQQFIEKEFEFQYLGCSINEGEKIIIPGRTHIETANSFNNLTFLKYQESKVVGDATILEKTERFIRATGYSGLFSVEFMHGRDGKDYFLEMNFRNDGNGIAVTSSGTNLPYIWFLSCIGADFDEELKQSKVKTTYMLPEVGSLLSWINGNITFNEYKHQLHLTNCHLTYFKEDTSPFYAYISQSSKGIFLNIVVVILKKLGLYNFIKRLKK